MRPKTKSSYIVFSLLILSSLTGAAQQASAEAKIGIVNFRQLLVDSPDLKTAMDALRAEFEPRRRELLKMQSNAKAHPGDEQLQRDFTLQATEFQNSASSHRTEATQKVASSLVEAIRTYAIQEDLDFAVGGKPLFLNPLLDKAANISNVTAKVQAFIRNPHRLPPSTAIAAESAETKVGVVRGLDLEARSGEEIKRIKDYANEQGFEMVLDTIYYSKPRFVITDITEQVKPPPEWQ
jgi:Skp family chaperone for outer membrane proteins